MSTDLLLDLNKWEEERLGLVEKLQGRLVEIEQERQFILAKLREVDAPATNGHAGVIRSNVGRAVLGVLAKAGDAGLPARDVTIAVRGNLRDSEISHGLVATHLSRLKRRGRLTSHGDVRSLRYVFITSNK